ncbi:hypothetical protein RFI_05629, partial [Reticulomyxa filosa]
VIVIVIVIAIVIVIVIVIIIIIIIVIIVVIIIIIIIIIVIAIVIAIVIFENGLEQIHSSIIGTGDSFGLHFGLLVELEDLNSKLLQSKYDCQGTLSVNSSMGGFCSALSCRFFE